MEVPSRERWALRRAWCWLHKAQVWPCCWKVTVVDVTEQQAGSCGCRSEGQPSAAVGSAFRGMACALHLWQGLQLRHLQRRMGTHLCFSCRCVGRTKLLLLLSDTSVRSWQCWCRVWAVGAASAVIARVGSGARVKSRIAPRGLGCRRTEAWKELRMSLNL